ncbi:MAG: aminopeptidase P family protein [Deltaproteobacteria bacterium]|nr:aminopeptidase P family protein [Deltaproteobacteria bacterium]
MNPRKPDDAVIANRLERLRESLSEKNLDALLVLVEENRRYLSGFTGEDTHFDESAGALIITRDKLILATDSRFELQAGNEATLYEIVCYKEGLAKALPKKTKNLKVQRLGFEIIRMSYYLYGKITKNLTPEAPRVELVETSDIVEMLRVTKEESEIEATRNALVIAELAFRKVAAALTPDMTEKEAAWAMEKEMREAGADGLSFPTIVASGPNSALPHAIPGDRKLSEGEPILFDWGARLNGYCSDTSRTLVIGTPDETFETVYNTVLDAQQKAIDAIRPGMSSKAVDEIARNHIAARGFKDKFGHGLGHGTGLAVHEAPRLSPLRDTRLEPGMIFTVEPGIYLPGWGGIRIENQVVVREDGAEVLNGLNTAYSPADL